MRRRGEALRDSSGIVLFFGLIVECIDGLLNILIQHPGIACRGSEVAVAQHLLGGSKFTGLRIEASEVVTQIIRGEILAVNSAQKLLDGVLSPKPRKF